MKNWYSINIEFNSNFYKGYFSSHKQNHNSKEIIQHFYNQDDSSFSNNLLLHIEETYNSNDSDNELIRITSLGSVLVSSSPYEFTINGIIITDNTGFFENSSKLALWTDNMNNSRLSYYNRQTKIWTTIESGEVGPFDITLISDPSCFNEGTKILYLNKKLAEEYILIENLRIGDLVKTYKHGYKKVELIGKNKMINNKDEFKGCLYKMEKTDENGLIEDLIITWGHSILVDNLGNYEEETNKIFGNTPTIEDKYLLLAGISKDFKQIDGNGLYTYYHFIVENDVNDDENMRFGVWANGILTETPTKNFFLSSKYTLL